jgi:hypothetical protein
MNMTTIQHSKAHNLDRYLALKLSDAETNSFNSVIDCESVFDVTKFWFDSHIQSKFPLLSRLAIGVLSVPASSAVALASCSSERVFSTADRVLVRARLVEPERRSGFF